MLFLSGPQSKGQEPLWERRAAMRERRGRGGGVTEWLSGVINNPLVLFTGREGAPQPGGGNSAGGWCDLEEWETGLWVYWMHPGSAASLLWSSPDVTAALLQAAQGQSRTPNRMLSFSWQSESGQKLEELSLPVAPVLIAGSGTTLLIRHCVAPLLYLPPFSHINLFYCLLSRHMGISLNSLD